MRISAWQAATRERPLNLAGNRRLQPWRMPVFLQFSIPHQIWSDLIWASLRKKERKKSKETRPKKVRVKWWLYPCVAGSCILNSSKMSAIYLPWDKNKPDEVGTTETPRKWLRGPRSLMEKRDAKGFSFPHQFHLFFLPASWVFFQFPFFQETKTSLWARLGRGGTSPTIVY